MAPSESQEMLELATNWGLLESLAGAAGNGSRVFAAEEVGQLIERLTRQDRSVARRPEPGLWEWWPTLALLVLLLTAEWALRKWAGLP